MTGHDLVERLALSFALAIRADTGELFRLVQDQEHVGPGTAGVALYVALRAVAGELEASLVDTPRARALVDGLVQDLAAKLEREPETRRRAA